jgi:hypothetical protein
MMQHAHQASSRERATREADHKDFKSFVIVVGQPFVRGSNVMR